MESTCCLGCLSAGADLERVGCPPLVPAPLPLPLTFRPPLPPLLPPPAGAPLRLPSASSCTKCTSMASTKPCWHQMDATANCDSIRIQH